MSDPSEASGPPPDVGAIAACPACAGAVCPTHNPWALRPGEAGDLHFVADSWRRNYVGREELRLEDQEFLCWQGAVVDRCLSNSQVLVAHPLERHQQILGWCCYRRPATVHYVYVKPYYRRNGIGKALMREALVKPDQHDPGAAWSEVRTTHRWNRPHAEGIGAIVTAWQRTGGRLHYNPALIFGGKT